VTGRLRPGGAGRPMPGPAARRLRRHQPWHRSASAAAGPGQATAAAGGQAPAGTRCRRKCRALW